MEPFPVSREITQCQAEFGEVFCQSLRSELGTKENKNTIIMKEAPQKLTTNQKLMCVALALAFVVPAYVMVERQIGPGRWIIEMQDRFLGGHYTGKSMLLLTITEIICLGIVGIVVRRITGRTLVDILTKKKPPHQ